ncbi:hypothetical protein AA313_de0202189 [Arthrobotrys entomopaga]|nr:hypothetical protein AA313_de0202189 [Arthrobotrys entomopaga]
MFTIWTRMYIHISWKFLAQLYGRVTTLFPGKNTAVTFCTRAADFIPSRISAVPKMATSCQALREPTQGFFSSCPCPYNESILSSSRDYYFIYEEKAELIVAIIFRDRCRKIATKLCDQFASRHSPSSSP